MKQPTRAGRGTSAKKPRPTRTAGETKLKVEQLMTKDVGTCMPGDSLERAAQVLWEQDCGCVPVLAPDESGRVIAMLTDRDVCMSAYTRGMPLRDLRVSDAMSGGVTACRPASTVAEAEALMAGARVRRLPVLDDGGQLLGILSLADIAREAERERTSRKRKQVKADEVGRTLAAICRAGT